MAKNRKNNTPQRAAPRGLTGWLFLIIEESRIAASGQILGNLGSHHVVQFQGTPTYTRMMNEQQMEILTLFSTEEERQTFMAQWVIENQSPEGVADLDDGAGDDAEDGPEGCDETGPDVTDESQPETEGSPEAA